MAKQYEKEFKINALKYVSEHPEISLEGCAKNLGVSSQTLYRWQKQYAEKGENFHRGSGNYSSDDKKEIARLKRELRDTKDALDILKKAISILGD